MSVMPIAVSNACSPVHFYGAFMGKKQDREVLSCNLFEKCDVPVLFSYIFIFHLIVV